MIRKQDKKRLQRALPQHSSSRLRRRPTTTTTTGGKRSGSRGLLTLFAARE